MPNRRGSDGKRLYSRRWAKAGGTFLRRHPYCVKCEQVGRRTLATVVDHIKPHRGDMELFWASSNWQGLCKLCHDGAKQAEEKGGGVRGVGVDGLPLDPGHLWRKG